MSSQEQKSQQRKQAIINKQKENFKKIQHSFQIATIIAFVLLGCCTTFIIQFREMAVINNTYIVEISSFKIALLSCFSAFIIRYLLQKISVNYLQKWLHPKYLLISKEQVNKKLNKTGECIYDFVFHTSMTFFCYYSFKHQNWFPSVLGGKGECQNITKTFSPWPSQQQAAIYFLQIQIGSYLFLIADTIFLKQQQLRKINFGELIFHHTITICMLLSGLFFNQIKLIIIGVLIHDISDTFRSLNRVIKDLKLTFIYPTFFDLSFALSFGSWIYTRMLVLPVCLILQLIDSVPDWNSQGWFSIPAYVFGIVISVGLFFLQCYWSVILLRAYKSEKKRNIQYATKVLRQKQKQK